MVAPDQMCLRAVKALKFLGIFAAGVFKMHGKKYGEAKVHQGILGH